VDEPVTRWACIVFYVTTLAVPGIALGQAVDYFALGDSITYGKTYSGGACGTPYTGGYPPRLDQALQCSACTVDNEGVNGDTTAQMLTRVDGILNSKDYDVMLLMGGTNDIFHQVSTATIRDTLRAIADKAANKGVDTVFAPIIHFHPNVDGSGRYSAAADLKTKVSALASESAQSGYFVDTWSELCLNANCFKWNYLWRCVELGKDSVGHPNDNGHNVLATLFKAQIEKFSLPTTPTPVTPMGEVTPPSSFNWTLSGSDTATWYQVRVDGPEGNKLSKWYKESVCSGSNCSVSPVLAYSAGSHTWKVRGRSPRGKSSWSATQAFEVITEVPEGAIPMLPAGDINATKPSYLWTQANGASSYLLEIQTSGGAPVFDQTYSAESVCGTGSCSVVADSGLAVGAYQWQITPENLIGSGPTSDLLPFTRLVCSPPTLELDNETVNTPETYQACESITAGDLLGNGQFAIGGDVLMYAGGSVILTNGFVVLEGGSLEVRVDLQ
jgi:lysophospholipase L1-like esterase